MSENNLLRAKAVIVVGNKSDLVRRRAVTTRQGTDLAIKHRVKFIETSSGQGILGFESSLVLLFRIFNRVSLIIRNGTPG